jgi:hypothetical protein
MPGAISPAIWRPQQVAAGRAAMPSDLDYV